MRHVDVDSVPAELFGLSDELGRVGGDWHAHTRHQLLFARSGVLRLEVHDHAWVLPPRQAAWVRAGVVHRISVKRMASLHTLYVDRRRATGPDTPVRVFPTTGLGREMIMHAMRWGPDRDPDDPVAEAFFGAMVALLDEWTSAAAPYGLPLGRSDTTRAAIRWTFGRLDRPGLSVDGAARAAGTSARTLRRRMLDETGGSWRDVVQQARLLRAVEALSDPAASVQQACDAAGYQSLGSFSRSFSEALGESPRAWQRRATGP